MDALDKTVSATFTAEKPAASGDVLSGSGGQAAIGMAMLLGLNRPHRPT